MSEKKCPACGASIDVNATECNYCGAPVGAQSQQNQQQQYQENQQQYNQSHGYTSSEFSYLKPYYQIEFEKIQASNEAYKGRFNWCAFFFSWIWGFTKGLWGPSLITLVLFSVLSRTDFGIFNLAIWIIWGLRGNYFYYYLIKHNKQFPDKL